MWTVPPHLATHPGHRLWFTQDIDAPPINEDNYPGRSLRDGLYDILEVADQMPNTDPYFYVLGSPRTRKGDFEGDPDSYLYGPDEYDEHGNLVGLGKLIWAHTWGPGAGNRGKGNGRPFWEDHGGGAGGGDGNGGSSPGGVHKREPTLQVETGGD
ncbi:hypothetical protein TWF730_000239 [Orbilia blumenaviensis]|uniref:Uncharacterized protein n=1 Tax=Orbilia blumenaviensis TaxID=1796055 RepID=A0AAV9VKX9_9PEZI